MFSLSTIFVDRVKNVDKTSLMHIVWICLTLTFGTRVWTKYMFGIRYTVFYGALPAGYTRKKVIFLENLMMRAIHGVRTIDRKLSIL
jgi:hypothetical protein